MKKDNTQADVCGNCGHAREAHYPSCCLIVSEGSQYSNLPNKTTCRCKAFTPPAPQAEREKAIAVARELCEQVLGVGIPDGGITHKKMADIILTFAADREAEIRRERDVLLNAVEKVGSLSHYDMRIYKISGQWRCWDSVNEDEIVYTDLFEALLALFKGESLPTTTPTNAETEGKDEK